MGAHASNLQALIENELRRIAAAPVTELAGRLAQRGGLHTVAVLFYGSALRCDALEGVLDFYVLLDRVGAWTGSRVAALANRLLPPNVGYFEGEVAGRRLRAKYAVMSLAQFQRGMSTNALDTTLWARFSQPCICVWARSQTDRDAAGAAVREATIAASRWAAELGPPSATAVQFWRSLFARTYDTELRVERLARSDDIVDRDSARFTELLPLAWRAAGIDYEVLADSQLAPSVDTRTRHAAARRWARRRLFGKPLNIFRLLKAAFTFEGAMDYVAWKVERHSGVHIELSPWQRRYPLLAAPGLYWRLRRRGVLR